jgi:hypothetical protein
MVGIIKDAASKVVHRTQIIAQNVVTGGQHLVTGALNPFGRRREDSEPADLDL